MRGFFVLLILGTLAAAYRWQGYIVFRVAQYYWFQQAMAHVTPPDTTLLESDPQKALALFTKNPEYFDQSKYVPMFPGSPAAFKWTRDDPVAIYVPTAVRSLEPYLETKGDLINDDDAVVFAGERRTPSGKQRLVIIRGALPGEVILTRLQGVVVAPPSILRGAEVVNRPLGIDATGNFSPVQLSSGLADPVDPTHITISYQGTGTLGKGILDVFLGDNDQLIVSCRNN